MPTRPAAIPLKVSKSTLSMFLRTRCDKELFLSLHDKARMGSAGLPVPIKRPGIGILAVEGKEFELERNDTLVRLFPSLVKFSKSGATFNEISLQDQLSRLTGAQAIILQGKFSISAHQVGVLANIGVTPTDIGVVPPIADFIPDVIYVRPALEGEMEVRPNGTRLAIDKSTETRLGLSILDIKHTAEANPSYCSEIAMYALMLANWLAFNPLLAARFYISSNSYLWTRFKQGESALDERVRAGGATTPQLLDALIADSEDAQLRFYLSAIRGFFTDVARVVRLGQARQDGWKDLDWHVASSCGSCDWLGDKRHMGQDQRSLVDASPDSYCMPLASATGHLCLVPGITRGAKKVLRLNTVHDTPTLAGSTGHPALQLHTLLKREAKTLPIRSGAITTGALSIDPDAVLASLVPSAHLLLYASVNFDSSSGLLTGLALSGIATTFTPGQSPRRFPAVPFVVDQKTLSAEWVALEGFLTQIANHIASAEAMVTGSVKGQIHFWEQRQFEELCNAMGRHLPRVMALNTRKAKALAWIFSPEEMIARPDSLEAATVVAIDEIVRRLVFAPTRHVITLFDTVEHYRTGPSPAVHDAYYREYLSNGIPRERIYEIWSNATQVKRGAGNVVPRNTVIAQYSDALMRQSRALEAVCERLRQDFRGRFRAKATHIPTSIPSGARGVAFDSKLWIWWDQLEFNVSQLEAHIRLSMDGERLEANYEAVILKAGTHVAGDIYEFDIGPGSAEAKFKEDSILTLGKLGHPGMPLLHGMSLLRPGSPTYTGNTDLLSRPLWSLLEARLLLFDRSRRRARVQLRVRDEPLLVPYLIANSQYSMLDDVFLVESKKPRPFNWAEHSTPILEAIGNPNIATPDINAAVAMGITPTARRGGASAETPAARVLWTPSALEQREFGSAVEAQSFANYVRGLDGLNDSQELAVAHALGRALSIIWGPPGTGKTKTLAASLHAMTVQALRAGRPLRVLVTGPTYKAVEEVMKRTATVMSADPTAVSRLFMGYSQGRTIGANPTGLAAHVDYQSVVFDRTTPGMQQCLRELVSGTGVTIVGCQVRQGRQFPKFLGGGTHLHPVFDVVIIDESSQVPVSHAVSAFSGLLDDSRLIIAGDHLQMPPIASIEAPADAAYMVGSIQSYLTKRAFSTPVTPCLLERNYRSADDIVAFARSIGYPLSLQAEYGDARLHFLRPLPVASGFPAHLPWCDGFNELLRQETAVATLLHEDDISSQANPFEAKAVAGMVWMLRQSVSCELDNWGETPVPHRTPTPQEFWSRCIGIVTPHRAQRALVVRELEGLFPGEENFITEAVDTVERFQGGERHTIIVTFGVADVDVIGGEEAFLMQLERTNVAISRAMAKCIVVMPDALAAHIPEDKRALQTAHALKDYVEEFCNHRAETTLGSAGDFRNGQIRYRR